MAPSRPEDRLARRGGIVEWLRVPAALFAGAVRLRGAAYDHGIAPVKRVSVPVISVGNLTTGGTGKTPMCAFLVHELARRGLRPGILSRGYRAESAGALNDEGRLLERLCPSVPHVQDKDRGRGARALVERGVDAIVLDDGFQHRRLARDLDFVLVDALRPWGLAPIAGDAPVSALLPRGLLREPPSALRRADAIVLTRADAVDARVLDGLERELELIAPGKPRVITSHSARAWRDEKACEFPLATLSGREVDVVSALGNPSALESSVRATGAFLREHRVFPDHHRYRASDLAGLGAGGRVLVTSAKDGVKLEALEVPFFTLEIELSVSRGAAIVAALLDSLPRAQGAAR